jgi:hypothetical protein
MGTLKAVGANRIEIQGLDGKPVICLITPQTRFLRGDSPAASPNLQVGERAMVDFEERSEGLIALKVRLGKRP